MQPLDVWSRACRLRKSLHEKTRPDSCRLRSCDRMQIVPLPLVHLDGNRLISNLASHHVHEVDPGGSRAGKGLVGARRRTTPGWDPQRIGRREGPLRIVGVRSGRFSIPRFLQRAETPQIGPPSSRLPRPDRPMRYDFARPSRQLALVEAVQADYASKRNAEYALARTVHAQATPRHSSTGSLTVAAAPYRGTTISEVSQHSICGPTRYRG
jgi:hypothetical protein